MALVFGGATSDRVDCGSAAGIDDLNPFTVMMWVYMTTFTSGRRLASKRNSGGSLGWAFALTGTNNLICQVARATSPTDFRTNSAPLATNAWRFLAMVFDSAAAAGEAANIYSGTLSAIATECTYGTALDGSGAVAADAAQTFKWGNQMGDTVAFQGRIGPCCYVNRALTLGEIRSWQFRPRKISGAQIYMHLGFAGTGTQPDWSGNANNGTVTGATVGADVPLPSPWAWDTDWMGAYTAAGAAANSYDWLATQRHSQPHPNRLREYMPVPY